MGGSFKPKNMEIYDARTLYTDHKYFLEINFWDWKAVYKVRYRNKQ